MRRVLPVLLLLLLPAPAAAQAKVRGDATYKPYQKIVLKAADVTSAKASFLWDVDGDADIVEAGDTLYVWAPPGAYRVRLTAVDFESKKVERARFAFKVEGDVPPSPPGPGPGPGPKPKPPTPTPTGAVKVLIVEEAKERTKLPQAQQLILLGKPMRDFLNAKCAAEPNLDSHKAWTIQDKDTDLSELGPWWQAAISRPRGQVPWIVIGNEKGEFLYEGALPPDVSSAQALIGKYTTSALRKADRHEPGLLGRLLCGDVLDADGLVARKNPRVGVKASALAGQYTAAQLRKAG